MKTPFYLMMIVSLLLVPGRSFADHTQDCPSTNGPTLNPNATFAISGISGLTNYYCLGDSISPSVICTNTPGTNETDIFDDDCNETNIYDSCSASSLGGTNNTWSFSLGTFSTNGTGTSIPTMALTNYGAGTVSFHMGWTNTCTTNTGSVDTNATFFVVQLNSLDVAGATQIGPSTNNDWGAVKTNDYVILTANMNTSDIGVSNLVHWSGDGQAVPGNPLQWEVSKTNSLKYTVTVSCCSTSYTANVWIIWATNSYQFSGATPASAQGLWTNFGSTLESHIAWYMPGFTLGVQIYPDMTGPSPDYYFMPGTNAYAKECVIFQIQPPGINAIITNGFNIVQYKWCHEFTDTNPNYANDDYATDWVLDGPYPDYRNTHAPDSDDKVYAIDAPGIGKREGATSMYEVHQNYYVYETFNGIPCSDTNYWHFEAAWFAGPAQVINHIDLGATLISLPATYQWTH